METKRLAQVEISFLSSLTPHPNTVPFHGAVHSQGHSFLLFDLVVGFTLPERLNTLLTLAHRSTIAIIDISFDIVSGVVHLHAQNPYLALPDEKLENGLYDRFQCR